MYLRLSQLYFFNSIMLHVADRMLVFVSHVVRNQGLNMSQRITMCVAARMDLEMDGTKEARLEKVVVTDAAQTSMLGA